MLHRNKRFEGTQAWSVKYWAWLDGLRFEFEADQIIFDNYLTAVRQAKMRVDVLDQAIEAPADIRTLHSRISLAHPPPSAPEEIREVSKPKFSLDGGHSVSGC